MVEQRFVGRQAQLAELSSFLDRALASQGRVAFVVGEAGSGKTALIAEFARRAQEAHKDLVFAFGNCNAQTGIGDPYLPFREILDQLTGDVEAKVARGEFAAENTRRLSGAARWTLEFLLELGPDLINSLVPGAKLLTKTGTVVAKQAGWVDKLRKLVDSKAALLPGAAVDESRIFEQLTKVLKALAVKKPLVLVLDDLHWADAASMSLLFHLGRRVEGSRILVLGAYRPEEVQLGRDGERHPLDKVLTEFKRYFGDVWVDLDPAEKEEARQFVDALLDLEPNRLGGTFRQSLIERTGGHPLFAVELLRAMQEQGALEKDAEGRWREGAALDWEALPPRVEGVIEERITRLEEPLRGILQVASVEGETFTAEVVARVRTLEDRAIVGRLSNELERRHHLVAAVGIRWLAEQALSSYRFRHNLFQKYVYGSLDVTERAYLHQDVGRALEALYADQSDDIALQLAWHFQEAAVWDKAVHYWGRAGRQACLRYANDQAVADFRQALALLQDHPEATDPQGAANLYEGLGDVLVLVGQSEEGRSAYSGALTRRGAADRISRARLQRKTGKALERQRQHGEALRAYDLAEASLGPRASESDRDWWHEWVAIQVDRIWTSIWNQGSYADVSELARRVKPMVERFGTPAQRASFFRSLVLMNDMPEPAALDPATESYALAAVAASEESGSLDEIAQSLYYLGYFHLWVKNSDQALDELKSALTMAERIGDPYLQLDCLIMIVEAYFKRGNVEEVRHFAALSLPLATRLGAVEHEGGAHSILAALAWREGKPDEAQHHAAAARAAWGPAIDLGWYQLGRWRLIPIALSGGDLSMAIDDARKMLGLIKQLGSIDLTSEVDLAIAAWDASDAETARAHLEQARRLLQQMGYI